MKTKYPNASLLNILTLLSESTDRIIFFHVKIVPDYTNDEIYWFQDKGQKGRAKFIWKDLSLKQWLAFGKTEDIRIIINDLLRKSKLRIENKIFEFILPEHYMENSKHESVYKLKDETIIPRELLIRENLDILTGHRIDDKVKPLFPIGLYEQDFLYRSFTNKILGIVEKPNPFLTFKRIGDNVKKQEIIGFLQENFVSGKQYFIEIRKKSNVIVGQGKVNQDNGIFKLNLSESVSNGKAIVYYKDATKKEGIKIIKEKDFALIENIKLDFNIVKKTYKDFYGREFWLSSLKKRPVKELKPVYWDKELFHNDKIAYQKLSDLLKEVLIFLGENIVVADPYFIGELKYNEQTNEFELSEAQKALINAITHVSIEYCIEKIVFLGNNSKANSVYEKDDSHSSKTLQRFENYSKFFNGFIKVNKLQDDFPKIIFSNLKNRFHNRYWFSITANKNEIKKIDKCVIFTNSFGKMEELDIIPCTEKEQLNLISRRFLSFLDKSETIIEIQ